MCTHIAPTQPGITHSLEFLAQTDRICPLLPQSSFSGASLGAIACEPNKGDLCQVQSIVFLLTDLCLMSSNLQFETTSPMQYSANPGDGSKSVPSKRLFILLQLLMSMHIIYGQNPTGSCASINGPVDPNKGQS